MNTELNQKIRDVVRLCTGMVGDTVRPANQVAPTKGDIFATVYIATDSERGHADIRQQNIPGDPALRIEETATAQSLAMASIQFFRAGAIDAAKKLKRRIQMTDAQDLMGLHGLGFVKASDVRNLTMAVNEIWEERAQIDIEFHYVNSEVINVNTYGTFPVDVKMGADQSTSTEVKEP